MHLGGEKKFFLAVNGFEDQIFHWDGFSQGSDTRCAKHTSTRFAQAEIFLLNKIQLVAKGQDDAFTLHVQDFPEYPSCFQQD